MHLLKEAKHWRVEKLLEDRELLEGENDWKEGNRKKEENYLEELLEGRNC